MADQLCIAHVFAHKHTHVVSTKYSIIKDTTMQDKHINQWNPNAYNTHAHFVSEMALPVVDLLDPQPGEAILDLGCGEGTLGLAIAQRGADVFGIDISTEMIEQARRNGLKSEEMSVTEMAYIEQFDAIFSNAMLHWVRQSETAVAKIVQALKPGGRFVAEFGAAGNIHAIVEAMRETFEANPEYGVFENPWYFPTPKAYAQLLQRYGMEVEYIERIPRPTPIDDIANWLIVFTNGITKNLSTEQSEDFRRTVRDKLRPTLYSDKDRWVADYVRLRVKAVKMSA
jgi:2-isopropylmalate synthase